MEFEKSNGKAKLIAACVVIAAVAIIYLVTAMKAKSTTPEMATTSDTTTSTPAARSSSTTTTPTANSSSSSYKDGTYTASGSYRTPETVETINVTLTVKDNVVSDASIQQSPQDRESVEYQAAFKENYKSYVVGKKISDIQLSRVSGSSLTSSGFNTALEQIKTQAQS
jgi:uncharacterized protein with FMN-binding domain